jgi:hypothetical protein
MKAKAIILLLPFVLFITETISFLLQANSACKKMTCMKMKTAMKCPHQKDNCKKNTGKSDPANSGNCSNNSECSLCPVCSIFVFQPQFELQVKYDLLQCRYPSLHKDYVSSYTSEVWKPPNNYSLFL